MTIVMVLSGWGPRISPEFRIVLDCAGEACVRVYVLAMLASCFFVRSLSLCECVAAGRQTDGRTSQQLQQQQHHLQHHHQQQLHFHFLLIYMHTSPPSSYAKAAHPQLSAPKINVNAVGYCFPAPAPQNATP